MAEKTKRELIQNSARAVQDAATEAYRKAQGLIALVNEMPTKEPIPEPEPDPPSTGGYSEIIEDREFGKMVNADDFDPNTLFRRCIFDAQYRDLYAFKAMRADGGSMAFAECRFVRARNKAIMGHHFDLHSCTIEDCQEDGVFICGDDVGVFDTLIQRLGTKFGAHADAIQIACGKNLIIGRNNIVVPHEPGHSSNAAIYVESDFGEISNLSIYQNTLDGGGYTLFVRNGKHGKVKNLSARNNTFLRHYYATHIGLALDNSNDLSKATSNKPA